MRKLTEEERAIIKKGLCPRCGQYLDRQLRLFGDSWQCLNWECGYRIKGKW